METASTVEELDQTPVWGHELNPKTIKRLRRVVKAVLSQHKLLDMSEWCNSHACLAGFAVVQFDPEEWISYEKGIQGLTKRVKTRPFTPDYVKYRAMELIGLDDDQADLLFLPSEWPDPYMDQYDEAKSSKGRAKAVRDRVEYFIKTGR